MTKLIHKEVIEILNILKCYNNSIETKFVSVIFENLKFIYKLPQIYHKSVDLTCFSKIFEIDSKFYEFIFCWNDSLDFGKVKIFFNKIKNMKDIEEDFRYLRDYHNGEEGIEEKLQKILNNLTT